MNKEFDKMNKEFDKMNKELTVEIIIGMILIVIGTPLVNSDEEDAPIN